MRASEPDNPGALPRCNRSLTGLRSSVSSQSAILADRADGPQPDIVSVRPSSVVSVEFALRHCDVLKMVFDPTVERGDGLAQRSAKRSQRIFDPRRYFRISATRHEAVALEPPQGLD